MENENFNKSFSIYFASFEDVIVFFLGVITFETLDVTAKAFFSLFSLFFCSSFRFSLFSNYFLFFSPHSINKKIIVLEIFWYCMTLLPTTLHAFGSSWGILISVPTNIVFFFFGCTYLSFSCFLFMLSTLLWDRPPFYTVVSFLMIDWDPITLFSVQIHRHGQSLGLFLC